MTCAAAHIVRDGTQTSYITVCLHLVPVPDTVIIARKACHVVLRMCHKSATNVLQLFGYPQSLCILRE